MAESVTRNTTYLTLAYIGQKILSFFYFVMVARFIGVEDLGKYTFAISFTTLFAVFVDLGLNSALVREAAKFKERISRYLSSALAARLVLSLLIYGVVIAAINILGCPELTKKLVYLSGITMVFDQWTAIFWAVFRGCRNLKMESISIVLNQAIIVVAGLVVLFMRLPLTFLMAPFILASAFSLIFSAISVTRILKIKFQLKFDIGTIKFLFSIAVPFALIAIFSRIYGNIDSVMLSKLVGDKAVGWYSVAMKIPFALQFIPAALAAAIFPAFSHHFVHDKVQLKTTFERVLKFLTVAVLPISAGAAILARPIVSFFYGSEYLPAVLPLQILMLGLFFVFLNFPLGSLMNGCDRQITNTILVGVTMLVNVALNIYLIPKYSFAGASAAFFVSHGFLFFAGLFVARAIVNYDKVKLFLYFIKTIASALAMAAVILFLVPDFHFLALIPVGALIYVGAVFLTKIVSWSEIKLFFSHF
ncbi:flippase [Candidatus Falkowbacteria bacterium]|nr:flippase [Candidatus Falkowbacteria bacterium]